MRRRWPRAASAVQPARSPDQAPLRGKSMRVRSWRPTLGRAAGRPQLHRRQRLRRASWASSSNTASPSRSPSARTNPPCCRSCSSPSKARKLLIYSDHSSQHPTNAAELTNTSGKTLDGGPITVYDGGAYGGEALMETLKAGDKRLISYAVDLGTRITEAFGSKAGGGARDPRQPRHPHHENWRPKKPAPTPFATWIRRPRP